MSCLIKAQPSLAKSQKVNGAPTVSNTVCNQVFLYIASLTLPIVLEHGSLKHRNIALDHLVSGLLEYSTSEHGAKSVTKAIKEGGKETLDRIIKRMCEPAKG